VCFGYTLEILAPEWTRPVSKGFIDLGMGLNGRRPGSDAGVPRQLAGRAPGVVARTRAVEDDFGGAFDVIFCQLP
jgi:hypothetical protein